MTTQSTVIVAPLSPSHIVMVAMLAQHGPLAKESVIRKWNRLTEPKFRSQNLPIPSCPWCPLCVGDQLDASDNPHVNSGYAKCGACAAACLPVTAAS